MVAFAVMESLAVATNASPTMIEATGSKISLLNDRSELKSFQCASGSMRTKARLDFEVGSENAFI
jgi:hypothetical protein